MTAIVNPAALDFQREDLQVLLWNGILPPFIVDESADQADLDEDQDPHAEADAWAGIYN